MIDLNNVSLIKIEQKLRDLDKTLNELKKVQEQKEELEKYRDVLVMYLELKARARSPLATQQEKRQLRILSTYPIFSLFKGRSRIEKMESAYMDETSKQSLWFRCHEVEEQLNRPYKEQLIRLMKDFEKEMPTITVKVEKSRLPSEVGV